VVRLEIEEHAGSRLVDPLAQYLDLEPDLVFRTGHPVNLSRLAALHGLIPLPHLKFPSWHPPTTTAASGLANPDEIFARLRREDALLHHQRATGVSRSEWDSEPDAIEAEEAAVKALDASIPGAVVEHGPARTRWLGVDGAVSWIERRGRSLVIVVGAPVWAAGPLAAEVWTAARAGAPPKAPPAKQPARQPSKQPQANR
jgi:hypothetical protein